MQTDTIAERLGRLLTHVPDLTLERLEELAELSRGHASQIARGDKVHPWPQTLGRIAKVLGARAGWLTFGEGRRPAAERVRRAVKRAVALRRGRHGHAA